MTKRRKELIRFAKGQIQQARIAELASAARGILNSLRHELVWAIHTGRLSDDHRKTEATLSEMADTLTRLRTDMDNTLARELIEFSGKEENDA